MWASHLPVTQSKNSSTKALLVRSPHNEDLPLRGLHLYLGEAKFAGNNYSKGVTKGGALHKNYIPGI